MKRTMGRPARLVFYKGEEKTVAEWAKVLGIHKKVLQGRLTHGWTVERAFTYPVVRPMKTRAVWL